jgi:hypothetical protein
MVQVVELPHERHDAARLVREHGPELGREGEAVLVKVYDAVAQVQGVSFFARDKVDLLPQEIEQRPLDVVAYLTEALEDRCRRVEREITRPERGAAPPRLARLLDQQHLDSLMGEHGPARQAADAGADYHYFVSVPQDWLVYTQNRTLARGSNDFRKTAAATTDVDAARKIIE